MCDPCVLIRSACVAHDPHVFFSHAQVRGPLIGERDVPQFSFIRAAFAETLRDSLVEPRRAAISLDYEYLVQQV